MARTRVGIAGITGRMGRVLVQTALELPTVALGAASSRSQDELVVGQDAGEFVGVPAAGVAISGSLRYCRESFDVAIDFTQPEYSGELAAFCAEEGKPLVIGTTGHEEAQLAPVRAAAERVPVLMSPNMSVGINLMLNLLTETARVLGDSAQTDVVEMHHQGKLDAPSGTARALGEALAAGRGESFPECAEFAALKTGQLRDPAKTYFHTLRMADVVGVHQVIFAMQGERLELSHTAGTRRTFAVGAMHAARWLERQPPGLYSMRDMLAAGVGAGG